MSICSFKRASVIWVAPAGQPVLGSTVGALGQALLELKVDLGVSAPKRHIWIGAGGR